MYFTFVACYLVLGISAVLLIRYPKKWEKLEVAEVEKEFHKKREEAMDENERALLGSRE